MNYRDEEQKLKHARQLFEDAVDHSVESHREAHRAERFYHNTENEGQWDSDDIAYLRDAQRPVLSFNVIKPKLDTFLGMYADAQRTPVVAASGGDDELLAEVIDAVKSEMLEDANYEALSSRTRKTATITGECSIHVEVEPSYDGQDWIKINLYRILPFELHWDISSIEPDRSDARYLFWNRWLSKDEFINAYPEMEKEWDTLSKMGMPEGDGVLDDSTDLWNEFGDGDSTDWNDYDDDRWNRYYYDRHDKKVRVIRYEYKSYVDKLYLHNTESGEKVEITEDQRERAEFAIAMGMPGELIERKEEVVQVCEFIGAKVLAEYDEAGPFKGFSIVSYVHAMDEETGTPYGFVRNLFDPQMELNKSKSLEIEYLAQATAPGVTVEEDVVLDETAFMSELRRPAGMAVVKRNSLSEGRYQDRTPTPPSPAIMNRTAGAMELTNEISGIPSSSMLTPAEQGQAGMTVAIRYHKSRQSVNDPFANFEASDKNLCSKLVEVIVTAMPDDQIAAVLANESKYVIQQGSVVELAQSPDQEGQMIPIKQAAMRDIRSLRWNLDLEFTSENSTLRMLEMDLLMQLAQAGVPVDPEVLVERASNSRAVRERLKAYVEKVEKAQAEGAQAEQQAMQQQTQQFAQIEMGKVQESTRHNTATEQLEAQDMMVKARLKEMELWEKADEAEKDRLLEMATLASKLKEQRSGQAANNR
jgi:hypothetical protein